MLAIRGLQLVDLETRAVESRFSLIDRDLVRFGSIRNSSWPLLDTLIVVDGDIHHLTGNPGVDEFFGGTNKGIVGQNVRLLRQ